MTSNAGDREQPITGLLAEIGGGSRDVVDRLIPIVYGELRRIARRQLRAERADHTLNTTALVNEAYVKLVGLQHVSFRDRAHFLAIAAQAMRRILVDYAVARKTRKRGGAQERLELDDAIASTEQPIERLIGIDVALGRLEQLNERLSRVVECRVFGGMSIEETANALNVSPATIKRDWTLALGWLHRELGGGV